MLLNRSETVRPTVRRPRSQKRRRKAWPHRHRLLVGASAGGKSGAGNKQRRTGILVCNFFWVCGGKIGAREKNFGQHPLRAYRRTMRRIPLRTQWPGSAKHQRMTLPSARDHASIQFHAGHELCIWRLTSYRDRPLAQQCQRKSCSMAFALCLPL